MDIAEIKTFFVLIFSPDFLKQPGSSRMLRFGTTQKSTADLSADSRFEVRRRSARLEPQVQAPSC
ncbi:hypothetical protein [Paenibacillus macerans]|uniref:hypothetical protein n=1 Tax=Paenibacillus macerans TaxID=44252 RepID=UPI001D132460|nr:hypothetical protein [Paenibacillus macerans]MDU5950369.1 hypothetical protein [Paenibacillus macerans]